jgi:hypothetical protein
VLENLGPAATKLGQIAASHPGVPEEIRVELEQLKYAASVPKRWEVTSWADLCRESILTEYKKNAGVPEDVTISRIGRVLGSASMFIAVEIEFSDGQTRVLAIRRPYAQERAEAEIATFNQMLNYLPRNDDSSRVFADLIRLTRDRVTIEANCLLAKEQFDLGRRMYHKKTVTIDGKKIDFSSAEVLAQGHVNDIDGAQVGYYLMSKVEGSHFISLPGSTPEQVNEKKQFAQVILTVELNNIFRGLFDSDRHGAQLKILYDLVGNFDFKATALTQWEEGGFRQLGEVLGKTVARWAITGGKVDRIFLSEQERVRRKYGSVDPLVTEVQRALLSLGDFMKVLTPAEQKRAFISALSNGTHPAFREGLLAHCPAVLRPHLEGWLRTGQPPGIILSREKREMREDYIIRIQSTP